MKQLVVLLSTYNGQRYLNKQLNSLLTQSIINNMRIIVRDDGSTDGQTLSILRQYKNEGLIDLWERKNVGVIKSFFDLLLHAPDADYYAFCDQDDFWLPLRLEKAVEKLESHSEPSLYCSRKIIVDQNLKKLPRNDVVPLFGPLDALMKRNVASGCTMVFNQTLRNLCLKFTPSEDDFQNLYHDTWLFILARFTGTIIYDNNSYILYRQHDHNVVGAIEGDNDLFIKRIRTFDWTFARYRKRYKKATFYATILSRYYDSDIKPELRNWVHEVAKARNSFSSRVRVFLSDGFTHTPLYEYLVFKAYILLGWF